MKKDANGHVITPRGERNRPLGTVSLSPEAWEMLDKIAGEASMSRSAAIESLIRARHKLESLIREHKRGGRA